MSAIIPLPGVASPVPAKTRKKKARKTTSTTPQVYREKLLVEAKEKALASDDPVFYAIVRHLTAVIALRDHIDRTRGMTFEEEEKDQPHMRRLWITCDVRLQYLLWTNPETLEGVVALLEHLGRNEFLNPQPAEHDGTFLTSFEHYSDVAERRCAHGFPFRLSRAILNIVRFGAELA